MVKKITSKNKKLQNIQSKKKKTNTVEKSNSLSIMILAIIGIILLIYFGTTGSVSVDINVSSKSNEISNTLTDETIVVSGIIYSSPQSAMEKLKFLPQSVLSDEERNFVESYKE